MTKVLLTLGDSWPGGVELQSTDRCYGETLKQLLEFDEFYNYGQGGSSNEHMILQLQNYFEKHHHNLIQDIHLGNLAFLG